MVRVAASILMPGLEATPGPARAGAGAGAAPSRCLSGRSLGSPLRQTRRPGFRAPVSGRRAPRNCETNGIPAAFKAEMLASLCVFQKRFQILSAWPRRIPRNPRPRGCPRARCCRRIPVRVRTSPGRVRTSPGRVRTSPGQARTSRLGPRPTDDGLASVLGVGPGSSAARARRAVAGRRHTASALRTSVHGLPAATSLYRPVERITAGPGRGRASA